MKYIYNKVRILIFANKRFHSTRLIVGILIGGLFGFLYYLLTNFTSHPPSISATPWFPIMYGLVLGALLSKS